MVKKKKGIICLFSLDKIFDLIEAELILEEDAEFFTIEEIEEYKANGFTFFEYEKKQINIFNLLE